MPMNIAVITLFPEMLAAVSDYGVTGRAVAKKLVHLHCINPRQFAQDRHNTVDDRPYGGGPGMVMMAAPLWQSVQSAKAWLNDRCSESGVSDGPGPKVVYMSPQGRRLDQAGVESLRQARNLVLIAGRYEGVDERFIDECVDEEWSIGDYVLSGGELPAMVLIDALVRLEPDVLGAAESAEQDSFVNGLLDCPHYTRPEVFNGLTVPQVLLSGDHGRISKWRLSQSLGRTAERRPDLLASRVLTPEQRSLLEAYWAEKEVPK